VKVPFVDLKAQYQSIAGDIDQALARVVGNANFILGEDVSLFEAEFAEYCETAFCVGLDSGTSALELALRAFDIGPGAEVITVANTFVATVSAIAYTGARPVLVDADPETYSIDVEAVARAITPNTRAIIPVHLFGQPVDMEPLLDLARRKNIRVIEDACQAHGAEYHGKRVGSLADIGCFSFYPGKNLGAYGDAGALVTNDPAIAQRVRMLRDYGQTRKYHHQFIGYNRRLDTLQAAVLRVKLPNLDGWNSARARHAETYNAILADSPVVTPTTANARSHVYHLYVVRLRDRDKLQAYLQELGIATGIHYPIPIHLQEAFAHLGYHRGDFPVAEQCADQMLSLPMYPELTQGQIAFVASAVREFLGISWQPSISPPRRVEHRVGSVTAAVEQVASR
jgi:dTDP-4-amino-4,6-dideoxygalactose transaminase